MRFPTITAAARTMCTVRRFYSVVMFSIGIILSGISFVSPDCLQPSRARQVSHGIARCVCQHGAHFGVCVCRRSLGLCRCRPVGWKHLRPLLVMDRMRTSARTRAHDAAQLAWVHARGPVPRRRRPPRCALGSEDGVAAGVGRHHQSQCQGTTRGRGCREHISTSRRRAAHFM